MLPVNALVMGLFACSATLGFEVIREHTVATVAVMSTVVLTSLAYVWRARWERREG